jgi:branched-chain amino acid transport system substrate-binding protein
LRQEAADRAKLRAQLQRPRGFVGIDGVFSVYPTDHSGLKSDAFVMITIGDGRSVPAEEQQGQAAMRGN